MRLARHILLRELLFAMSAIFPVLAAVRVAVPTNTLNILYSLIFLFFSRYVLDGDREELRNIRHELANLRLNTHGQAALGQEHGRTLAPVNLQQEHPHQHQIGQQGHGQRTQPSPPAAPQRLQPTPTPSPPESTVSPRSPPQGPQHGPQQGHQQGPQQGDSRRGSEGSVGSVASVGSNGSRVETDERDLDEDESPRTPISFSFPHKKDPLIAPVTSATSIMSIFGSDLYAPPAAPHHLSQRASPMPQPQTSNTKKLEQGHGQLKQHEPTQEEEDAQFLADYPLQISPRETAGHIKRQIQDLLQTGMYSDHDDPVITALKLELHKLESNL